MTQKTTIIPSQVHLATLLNNPDYAATRKEMEAFDFVVRTDGSAVYDDGKKNYVDDFGGYACFTASVAHMEKGIFDFGMSTGLDTNRAELNGALMGLRRAYQTLRDARKLDKSRRASVRWIGDRQNLTDAVACVSSRKADKDLWARFAFYEQYLDVSATHVKRDVGDIHAIVDRVSADMRAVSMAYARAQNLRRFE